MWQTLDAKWYSLPDFWSREFKGHLTEVGGYSWPKIIQFTDKSCIINCVYAMLESVSFLITSVILTGDRFSCSKSIALKRQPKPEIQQKKKVFSMHGHIIRFGPHSFVVKML